MKFYELPVEERAEITKRIQAIIGKKDDCIREGMSNSQKIKARFDYDKQFEKLADVYVRHGGKALAANFTDYGSYKIGATASGKKWILYSNNGYTERSRYCGTLAIDGEGTIFTSGTLSRAFEYIFTH